MAYKALYRTYRPQTFEKVVGQETVVKTLQNAIINNKISHAYLFCGPRGTGKTSVARIFAKALNCPNVTKKGEPCCDCYICKEIGEGISPDVIEIDAASNNGVDEIRDIRERIKFLPSGAKYKIYIVDEVHMLSTGAFNALLKILEEPPKHVIFILATTEPQKIPATIISRCQRFEFKPITSEKIGKNLKDVCEKENVEISDEAIDLISEIADGGMRDALSILDQTISYGAKDITVDDVNMITGSINAEIMCNLMSFIDARDANNALDVVNALIKEGKEINKIVNGMLLFCRDLMLYKSVGSKKINKYIFEKEKFQTLSLKIPNTKIIFFIEVLCDIQNKIKYSNSPGIYLEIAIIRMASINNEELNVVKRMNELENKLADNTFSSDGISVKVDNEKVDQLDTRLNQIVNELNKLELPELSKKVENIEETVKDYKNRMEDNSNKSESARITELESDFASKFVDLEAKINSIENGYTLSNDEENNDVISNVVSNDELNKIQKEIELLKKELKDSKTITFDDSKINEKLDNLLNRVQEIENAEDKDNNANLENDVAFLSKKIENIEDQVKNIDKFSETNNNSSLNNVELVHRIDNLENHINNISQEEHKQVETSVDINDQLEAFKLELRNEFDTKTSQNIEQLNKIDNLVFEDRLVKLEKQLYELMADKLALEEKIKSIKVEKTDKKPTVKKPKGQMSLLDFNIEIEDSKNSDFGELEKESVVVQPKEVVEETLEIISEAVIDDSDKKPIDISDNDEKIDENKQLSIFDFDIEKDEVKSVDEPAPTVKEEVVGNGLFSADAVNKETVETTQEVIGEKQTTNDNIEFKPKEENILINQYYNEDNQEEVVIKTNTVTVIKDTVVEEKPQVVEEIILPKEPEITDKFAKYDIKDLEKLLFDAQDKSAKNDKARILELWKTLNRGVDPINLSVANLLIEGKVVAVGNKELVITFDSITKCNETMRASFKSKAIKFLYYKLGSTYNYLALPVNVWNEKRAEYVDQYQAGNKRAKLTPFAIAGLNLNNLDEKDKNNDKIEQTRRMFGEDIVKIK